MRQLQDWLVELRNGVTGKRTYVLSRCAGSGVRRLGSKGNKLLTLTAVWQEQSAMLVLAVHQLTEAPSSTMPFGMIVLLDCVR